MHNRLQTPGARTADASRSRCEGLKAETNRAYSLPCPHTVIGSLRLCPTQKPGTMTVLLQTRLGRSGSCRKPWPITHQGCPPDAWILSGRGELPRPWPIQNPLSSPAASQSSILLSLCQGCCALLWRNVCQRRFQPARRRSRACKAQRLRRRLCDRRFDCRRKPLALTGRFPNRDADDEDAFRGLLRMRDSGQFDRFHHADAVG